MSTRAESMSLAELLKHHSKYTVPDFQRVYKWKEQQVEQLCSDLEGAMRRQGQAGESPFYLGTIYLSAPDGRGEAQIADGQQRILTATMLYAATRDLAAAEDDQPEADRLHGYLVDEKGQFKFAPRIVDADFFRRWVQERNATLLPLAMDEASRDGSIDGVTLQELPESQINIVRNRDAIVGWLKELGAAQRRRLLEFHEEAINVVVISASTLDEARNAHASTQTRGLVQAETDKLKSEFIGDCPERLRARLAGYWEDCEANLGQDHFAALFGHLIVIEAERKEQHALEADLARVFGLPDNVEHFIEQVLVPSAEAYSRILSAAAGAPRRSSRFDRRQTAINGHLTSLLRVTHNGWEVPAILACRQFGNNPAALEKFLRELERLAAVLMIAVCDPNRIIRRYVAVVRDLKRGTLATGTSLQLSAEELRKTREFLQDRKFADKDRFRMPALLKINDLLAGEVQPSDPKQLSCEHILPCNPPRSGPWYQDFKDARRNYIGGDVLHALGNLAILSHAQNRAADTNPYPFKRKILKASQFALSRDAAKSGAWSVDVINRRSERLYALLAAHWRLNEVG